MARRRNITERRYRLNVETLEVRVLLSANRTRLGPETAQAATSATIEIAKAKTSDVETRNDAVRGGLRQTNQGLSHRGNERPEKHSNAQVVSRERNRTLDTFQLDVALAASNFKESLSAARTNIPTLTIDDYITDASLLAVTPTDLAATFESTASTGLSTRGLSTHGLSTHGLSPTGISRQVNLLVSENSSDSNGGRHNHYSESSARADQNRDRDRGSGDQPGRFNSPKVKTAHHGQSNSNSFQVADRQATKRNTNSERPANNGRNSDRLYSNSNNIQRGPQQNSQIETSPTNSIIRESVKREISNREQEPRQQDVDRLVLDVGNALSLPVTQQRSEVSVRVPQFSPDPVDARSATIDARSSREAPSNVLVSFSAAPGQRAQTSSESSREISPPNTAEPTSTPDASSLVQPADRTARVPNPNASDSARRAAFATTLLRLFRSLSEIAASSYSNLNTVAVAEHSASDSTDNVTPHSQNSIGGFVELGDNTVDVETTNLPDINAKGLAQSVHETTSPTTSSDATTEPDEDSISLAPSFSHSMASYSTVDRIDNMASPSVPESGLIDLEQQDTDQLKATISDSTEPQTNRAESEEVDMAPSVVDSISHSQTAAAESQVDPLANGKWLVEQENIAVGGLVELLDGAEQGEEWLAISRQTEPNSSIAAFDPTSFDTALGVFRSLELVGFDASTNFDPLTTMSGDAISAINDGTDGLTFIEKYGVPLRRVLTTVPAALVLSSFLVRQKNSAAAAGQTGEQRRDTRRSWFRLSKPRTH